MTSETPDVVSRLLAKIAEVEQGYRDNQEALDLATSYEVAVGSSEYLRSTIADGLRLCQAHREIIALHEAQEYGWNPGDDVRCTECGHVELAAGLGLTGAQRSWPCRTLRALAGGYGIQEDPDD